MLCDSSCMNSPHWVASTETESRKVVASYRVEERMESYCSVGKGFSFGRWKFWDLQIEVMVTQHRGSTNAHFKIVHFLFCEFHLNFLNLLKRHTYAGI